MPPPMKCAAAAAILVAGLAVAEGVAAWGGPGGAVFVGRCGRSSLPACGTPEAEGMTDWVAVDEPPPGPTPPPVRGDAHSARNATALLHISIASFRDKLCAWDMIQSSRVSRARVVDARGAVPSSTDAAAPRRSPRRLPCSGARPTPPPAHARSTLAHNAGSFARADR